MTLRPAAVLAAIAILLSGTGIIWIQSTRLDLAERELKTARETLASTSRALNELEINFERTIQRKAASRIAQEAILSIPATQDRPISEMLLRALSGADFVGGFE